jgi:uncharacterized Ntn-hydrolase superfamily protein
MSSVQAAIAPRGPARNASTGAATRRDDFSVAGNMLAPECSPRLVDAFVARRLAALPSVLGWRGRRGGRRQRGQAAALRIHGDDDYPHLELRVDDHAEPIDELGRLYANSFERFQPFVACLASRRDPVGVLQRDEIEARVEAFIAARASTPTVPSTALPEVPR